MIANAVRLGDQSAALKWPVSESQSPHSSAVEILEGMDEAFYAIDRDWRFVYINRGAEDFWGQPRMALLGRSMLEAFPAFPGSESHAAHVAAMASGERSRIETIASVSP